MMPLSETQKRLIVSKFIDDIKPKIVKVIGRRYKEILDENKQLKEENEKLKELIKDMKADIQRARQSGYELGLNSHHLGVV